MRRSLPLLLAAALFVVSPSIASALTTEHIATDAELLTIIQSIAFVAEGRIGGASTFELDLGPDTGAPAVTRNYGWVSSQVEPFSIVYDQGASLVTFTLGGQVLQYAPLIAFEEVFVRARATEPGTTVSVSNLVLDGVPVGDGVSATGDGLDILRISGGVLVDGFTLTGDAVLAWVGAPPTQSRLAFQIKVGSPAPVPVESTTWGRVKRLY